MITRIVVSIASVLMAAFFIAMTVAHSVTDSWLNRSDEFVMALMSLVLVAFALVFLAFHAVQDDFKAGKR